MTCDIGMLGPQADRRLREGAPLGIAAHLEMDPKSDYFPWSGAGDRV
jgi:hypothetical protein